MPEEMTPEIRMDAEAEYNQLMAEAMENFPEAFDPSDAEVEEMWQMWQQQFGRPF